MLTVAIVNQSDVVTDDQLAPVVAALQKQIDNDFYPVWNVRATLVHTRKKEQVPAGAWQLLVQDRSVDSTLGFHTQTEEGRPIGYAFVRTAVEAGSAWSSTLSHEVLELISDPWTTVCAYIQGTKKTLFVAYEVCDPCEADHFGYKIDGVLVSDFVTPRWFQIRARKGPYDFREFIKRPLQLLPDGYIPLFDAGVDRWIDSVAEQSPTYKPPVPGTRRWLRQTRHLKRKL